MNVILLSGGSGKRLWPLSNDIRSKQFLKFFKDENGQKESMLQHVYSGIKKADKDAKIVIATSKKQVSSIHNQIGKDVMLSVEPERRDTFPAIILAALYMHDILGINENEPVVVCPVDPYVEDEYFEKLKEMSDVAKENDGLTLLGIEPSYPSEKYGYIIPEDDERISRVNEFVEKPDAKTAEKLIGNNALWNAGIFAFKMGYAIDKAKEITGVGEYVELFDKYESLEKISFDYAVAEHEKNIHVIRYDGTWMDLGTWNTFAEAIDDETIGNVVTDDECNNTNVINDLDIPILCMGLKDMIVAASADGILISDKEHSSYINRMLTDLKTG